MIGETIKHYEVLELLGQGGMGQVYKAQDRKLGRLVALKFLSSDLLSQREARARFINEARTISSLDHPNIATVFEIDEIDDAVFIAMAYYQGKTLRDMINAGPVDIEQTVDTLTQAAEGLAAAHAAGVIHRDIKPGNIMVTDAGLVKILDFGLAKAQNMPDLTQEQTVIGTAAYMSPEQIQGAALDSRTDLFSLGAVMYEMIVGERPFVGEYAASLTYTIVHEDPRPIRLFRSDIPDRLESIVFKALAKQKENRYQTASEIAQDLKTFSGPESNSVQVSRTRGVGKRPYLLAAVLLIAAAAVVFYAMLTRENSGGRRIESVAVLPFDFESNETDWSWLGDAVSDLVSTELRRMTDLRILNSQQRIRAIRSLGLGSAELDKSQALALAAEAGMEAVVLGNITKNDTYLVAQGHLITVPEGDTLASLTPQEGAFENLYDLADGLSQQLEHVLVPYEKTTSKPNGVHHPSVDAYRFYIEGKNAAFDLRHRESIAKLSRAIKIDSTLIQAYYWLAWSQSNLGFDDKAREVLKRGKPFIEGLSEEMQLEYLANEAVYDKRWQDYSDYLRRLIQLQPRDASHYYRYGRNQFYKFRQLKQGLENMEHALAINKNYAVALNTLAYTYAAQGDTARAMAMAKRYVALNPTDINPLDTMAEIQILLGRYDRAITSCERALAIDPDFPYSRIHLAKIFLEQRDYRAARRVIAELELRAPGPYFQSTAKLLRARSRLMNDEPQQALHFIDQSIEFDPMNREAHWLKGIILLQLQRDGAFQAQLAALEHALNMEGGLEGRWYLYHLQGEAALQASNPEKAIPFFKKALALWPLRRSPFLEALARGYRDAGRFQDAITEYHRALSINPRNGEALLGIAQSYEMTGRPGKAEQTYKKVLRVWAGAEADDQEIKLVKNKLTNL